jgi:hypothetical protein
MGLLGSRRAAGARRSESAFAGFWPVLGHLRFGDRVEEGGENVGRTKLGLRCRAGAGGRIGLLGAYLIRGGVNPNGFRRVPLFIEPTRRRAEGWWIRSVEASRGGANAAVARGG